MITDFLNDMRIFCYIVCFNDGFYCEPAITIDKVFLDYKDAVKYRDKIDSKHRRGAFIIKRRLYCD